MMSHGDSLAEIVCVVITDFQRMSRGQAKVSSHKDEERPTHGSTHGSAMQNLAHSARVIRRPAELDNATFALLLEEVLAVDDDTCTKASDSESAIEVSYKLVSVISKAGFQSTEPKDPFNTHDNGNKRLKDCLAAIRLTILRCPLVLFSQIQYNEGPEIEAPPMISWLLPQLATLIASGSLSGNAVIEADVLLSLLCSIQPKLKDNSSRIIPVRVTLSETLDEISYKVALYFSSDEQNSTLFPCHIRSLDIPFCGQNTQGALQSDSYGSSKVKLDDWAAGVILCVGIVRALAIDDMCQWSGAKTQLRLDNLVYKIQWLWNKVQLVEEGQRSIRFWKVIVQIGTAICRICEYETEVGFGPKQFTPAMEMALGFVCTTIHFNPPESTHDILIDLLRRCVSRLVDSPGQRLNGQLGALLSAQECLTTASDNSRLKLMVSAMPHLISSPLPDQYEEFEEMMPTRLRGESLKALYTQLVEQTSKRLQFNGWPNTVHVAPRICPAIGDRERITQSQILHKIIQALKRDPYAYEDFVKTAADMFGAMQEVDQVSILQQIGETICRIAHPQELGEEIGFECATCDAECIKLSPRTIVPPNHTSIFVSLLTHLTNEIRDQNRRGPRNASLIALRRLLNHTPNENIISLSESLLGQTCLSSLRSSLREVRISAGLTLASFVPSFCDNECLSHNQVTALEYLQKLSVGNEDPILETCILAWSQLLRTLSDGNEFNFALMKLVEFLGHPNSFLCSVAYDELQILTNHSPYTLTKMCAPYWRTIAVVIVQDVFRKPQVIQQVSELLAMSVADFLVLTQVHTIAFLILRKRKDIIQRIADAVGQPVSAICRDNINLAPILAAILFESPERPELAVADLLQAISNDFVDIDCVELLKAEPQATTAEIMKLAADVDEPNNQRALNAVTFLAGISHGKSQSTRPHRNRDYLDRFFDSHVLGIIAILADTVNDGKGPQPTLEKKRCLKAIKEMIKTGQSAIGNGLPQITGCLRSSMDNPDLVNESFRVWTTLVGILGEDDVSSLTESTFAIVVQHWDSLDSSAQQDGYNMIKSLLEKYQTLFTSIAHTLPTLAGIPLLAKFSKDLDKLKEDEDVKDQFVTFCGRLESENTVVLDRALLELSSSLDIHQGFLHEAASREEPDAIIGRIARRLLDILILHKGTNPHLSLLCSSCLGKLGCLDPTRIEATRDKPGILILSNFAEEGEIRDFIVFFLREVLVKAFLAATSSRSQGFLAFAIQELLNIGDFESSIHPRSHEVKDESNLKRWNSLPESIRTLLIPFLNSKYFVTPGVTHKACEYTIFQRSMSHSQWLRVITFDLLKRDTTQNTKARLFSVFSRIIRSQDASIANFLLPFVLLDAVLSGTEDERGNVCKEMLHVLRYPLSELTSERSATLACSQTVFTLMDYLSHWMQEKKKQLSDGAASGTRNSRNGNGHQVESGLLELSRVEYVLETIPADTLASRAVDCKSYERALFHWEQYLRQQQLLNAQVSKSLNMEPYFSRLQAIYAQIDEPDGIDGISANLQVLDINQQILEHRKAGRWTAAQSWYELQLSERPDDLEVQLNLLTSLRESGQHDALLSQVQNFSQRMENTASLPFAIESAWMLGKWDKLSDYVEKAPSGMDHLNLGLGQTLVVLQSGKQDDLQPVIDRVRASIAASLSDSNTDSLHGCHEAMLGFHALTEIETIAGVKLGTDKAYKPRLEASLDQRLKVVGPYSPEKQYLLGLRRAAMQLTRQKFSNLDIASVWLESAKIARKDGFTHQAFNAVLHATELGDATATIEHARLLWLGGNCRKAIRMLQGAIDGDAFKVHDNSLLDASLGTINHSKQPQQNLPKARAHLLLAKWIDRSGQTSSSSIIELYQKAVAFHRRWSSGHYHLGRHYYKLFETEKAKEPLKRAPVYMGGETAKLVIENYLRSLAHGAKYIHQILPRVLTLWLDLGRDSCRFSDPGFPDDYEQRAHYTSQRRKMLEIINQQMKKYVDRLPAWTWYTALPQIVARICHPSNSVYAIMIDMVGRVAANHPAQSLWTLSAMLKSSVQDRAARGHACVTKMQEWAKRSREAKQPSILEVNSQLSDLRKLSDQLLRVCEFDLQARPTTLSLTRDLGFTYRSVSSRLAVPVQACLTATMPMEEISIRKHNAFATGDSIRISSFLDDVLVLNSLQRPRKIKLRGSDGKLYALLCKPKDDLRKDQRLMEFNTMINRALKRDAGSSKRRLYIRTYAVTPLNESCGLIEWVDNLRTMRDIVLKIYKQKSVVVNYNDIRAQLDKAAQESPKAIGDVFVKKVLPQFPPVFHEWFVEMFSEPVSWFNARLRYTRSCAVMSIVGQVLGLGDRHGENILFEEGNGGTFHVDFNCLFDKGMTFEKPEVVPFRLTHNMVNAFGAYGYEGPFRRSCELTSEILRQHEDTLMTILETFLYDPTTDFIGKKRKKDPIVPETPAGVLERVRNKVRGLLPGESVPLSAEGYVDALIQQAVNPSKLGQMYIGWCAFI